PVTGRRAVLALVASRRALTGHARRVGVPAPALRSPLDHPAPPGTRPTSPLLSVAWFPRPDGNVLEIRAARSAQAELPVWSLGECGEPGRRAGECGRRGLSAVQRAAAEPPVRPRPRRHWLRRGGAWRAGRCGGGSDRGRARPAPGPGSPARRTTPVR